MRLHIARHDGTLPNKCDLCPRSFEGPKSLERHMVAHRLGRFVAPKMITNPKGYIAMVLPTESGVGGPGKTKQDIRTETEWLKNRKFTLQLN